MSALTTAIWGLGSSRGTTGAASVAGAVGAANMPDIVTRLRGRQERIAFRRMVELIDFSYPQRQDLQATILGWEGADRCIAYGRRLADSWAGAAHQRDLWEAARPCVGEFHHTYWQAARMKSWHAVPCQDRYRSRRRRMSVLI
jgi:hypothetical protein